MIDRLKVRWFFALNSAFGLLFLMSYSTPLHLAIIPTARYLLDFDRKIIAHLARTACPTPVVAAAPDTHITTPFSYSRAGACPPVCLLYEVPRSLCAGWSTDSATLPFPFVLHGADVLALLAQLPNPNRVSRVVVFYSSTPPSAWFERLMLIGVLPLHSLMFLIATCVQLLSSWPIYRFVPTRRTARRLRGIQLHRTNSLLGQRLTCLAEHHRQACRARSLGQMRPHAQFSGPQLIRGIGLGHGSDQQRVAHLARSNRSFSKLGVPNCVGSRQIDKRQWKFQPENTAHKLPHVPAYEGLPVFAFRSAAEQLRTLLRPGNNQTAKQAWWSYDVPERLLLALRCC